MILFGGKYFIFDYAALLCLILSINGQNCSDFETTLQLFGSDRQETECATELHPIKKDIFTLPAVIRKPFCPLKIGCSSHVKGNKLIKNDLQLSCCQ